MPQGATLSARPAADRATPAAADLDAREALRAKVHAGLTLVSALHDLSTLATACDAGLMLAGGQAAMVLDEDLLRRAARDPHAFERQTIDLLRATDAYR